MNASSDHSESARKTTVPPLVLQEATQRNSRDQNRTVQVPNDAPLQLDLRRRPFGMSTADWVRLKDAQNPIGLVARTPYYDDPGAMGYSIDCHSSDLEDLHEDV